MGTLVQFRAADQKEEPADTTLLTAVMEASTEGLAIVEGGCVVCANRVFARMFGYLEGAEIERRALADFIPESLFLFSADPEPVTSATEPCVCRCEGVRRDGQEIQLMVARAVLRTSQRELLVLNLRRLDEPKPEDMGKKDRQTANQGPDLQRLDLQRLESQRLEALGRVVASVAHDFNNLLTGVLLYCDLLMRGLEAGNPLRGYVEEIRKASGHSSGLIQQLLSAARPQGADTCAHSWSEVISGMHSFLIRMLGEQVELVLELDPRTAPVGVSESGLRQIVMNLLLNSRDAMPDGGRIMLACRNCVDGVDTPSELLDGYVEFSVTDTGCGMDANTRARLFEPFFTTKSAGKGNGLGLATVQRIVSEANGSLEVQSEPGKGTRIAVRLGQVQSSGTDAAGIHPTQVHSTPVSSTRALSDEALQPETQISA